MVLLPFMLLSKGFTLSYLKTNEIDTLFLTTQIKGNAYILYGFGMLDDDSKLPNSFALLGEVKYKSFRILQIWLGINQSPTLRLRQKTIIVK